MGFKEVVIGLGVFAVLAAVYVIAWPISALESMVAKARSRARRS